MIKKLQKKFIFSAMLAITILIVLLLGAINIGNAYASKNQNEQLINSLLNNETMKQPPRNEKRPMEFLSAPMDENFKMASVYFTIRTDSCDNIISTDVNRIANISEEEAEELFKEVIHSETSEGKIGSFRYKCAVNEHDNSKVYFFLDTTRQTHDVLRVLMLSSFIGFSCWIAMLLLVILLSKKAIRPVAENIERQKQFVTDAGHEIKTPLAIILSNTEAMELYNGENKWSKNIKEQVNRLNGLMQNLLTLAKSDENSLDDIKESVSLSELTENITDMFNENAKLKSVYIEKDIEQNIACVVNKELFSRLISILMDNAVKYSNQNGTIHVMLSKNEKHIQLEISNTCDHLPQCPANRLFDRFYRSDSARTQKNGGYGIGLSAAESIVRMHKGTINAKYKNDNTIVFKVKI